MTHLISIHKIKKELKMKDKLKVTIAGDLTIFSSQNALIRALKEQGHEYSEDMSFEVDILINNDEEHLFGLTNARAKVYSIEVLSEKEAISRLNLKVS